MKATFIFLLVTTSLLLSCDSGPKNLDEFMIDISEFTIDNELLKDGDYVEILGMSGNLTEEHKIDFYNLVVVRSEETGDTINVLLTNYYANLSHDPRTRFISNSSTVGKLIESVDDFSRLDGKKIEDIEGKSYKKVFYDSEYIQMDVRKYPAVTGNLGDWTIDGDLENFGKVEEDLNN